MTLWLSIFLFVYVDWQQLATCKDEQTCKANFGDYMIHNPFSRLSLWTFVVFLYCALFTCYGVFSIWTSWNTIRDAIEAKYFFEEKLGISSQKLEGGAIDWDKDVVSKLLELQTSRSYRFAIHDGNLDALIISQRIMRKENFMTAFFNRNLLDLSVPFLKKRFFCKSLEVSALLKGRIGVHSRLIYWYFKVVNLLLCFELYVQSQVPSTTSFFP